jgi:kynurenine formamidase
MRSRGFIIACILSLTLFLFAAHRQNASGAAPEFRGTVDLTHAMTQQTFLRPVEISDKYVAGKKLSDEFVTYIEAPAHFSEGSWTVDQIPNERLIAPLVVIDISSKAERNPDYQLSMEDVAAWEREHGNVPPGAIVMASTGWSDKWKSPGDYRNPDRSGDMHFPGFRFEAARFLVEARSIFGLGIDTMGVDYGASRNYPVRRYTSTHGVYQLENVANLDIVPRSGAIVIASPQKVEGSTEAPVRIMALLR